MSDHPWDQDCRCGHRYANHIAYDYTGPTGKKGCQALIPVGPDRDEIPCGCDRYVKDMSDIDGVNPGDSAVWDREHR